MLSFACSTICTVLTAEESVRLLLAFYRDAQPGPRAASLGDLPGVAPSLKVTCPDCGGKGERRVRLKAGRKSWRNADGALVAACEPCEGRGWRIVDDYTGDDVGSEETGARVTTRTVPCDACGGWGPHVGSGVHGNGKRCRHCQGAGTCQIPAEAAPERPSTRSDGDELTVALRAGRATGSARLWAAGSFAALERALGELTPHMRYQLWTHLDDGPQGAADIVAILTAKSEPLRADQISSSAEKTSAPLSNPSPATPPAM